MDNLLMYVSQIHIQSMNLLSYKAPSHSSDILSQYALSSRNKSNQQENTLPSHIKDENAIVIHICSKNHLLLSDIHWVSALSIHTSDISFDVFFDS